MPDSVTSTRPESLADLAAKAQTLQKAMRRRDPIAWMEENFYIKETGRPIQLERFQRAVLRYALQRNRDGSFRYQTVIWSQPKKVGRPPFQGRSVDGQRRPGGHSSRFTA